MSKASPLKIGAQWQTPYPHTAVMPDWSPLGHGGNPTGAIEVAREVGVYSAPTVFQFLSNVAEKKALPLLACR